MLVLLLWVFGLWVVWLQCEDEGGWLADKKVKSRFPYGRLPVVVKNWKDETLLTFLGVPFYIAAACVWVCAVGWRWWEAGAYGGWLVVHETPAPAYPVSMIKLIHSFLSDEEVPHVATN